MVEWVSGVIVPVFQTTIYLGMIIVAIYYLSRGLHNAWVKSWKFVYKYKIRKNPYPEETLKWCVDCIDKGIGWYDAKKILYLNNNSQKKINETMWVYDQLINELNKEKGGKK